MDLPINQDRLWQLAMARIASGKTTGLRDALVWAAEQYYEALLDDANPLVPQVAVLPRHGKPDDGTDTVLNLSGKGDVLKLWTERKKRQR